MIGNHHLGICHQSDLLQRRQIFKRHMLKSEQAQKIKDLVLALHMARPRLPLFSANPKPPRQMAEIHTRNRLQPPRTQGVKR